MKSKKEIEQLAETAFQDELIKSNQNINWIGYGKGIDGTSKEKWIELWIKGYTQCQEDWELLVKLANKRYTEEDLIQAIEKAIYLKGGFDKEGFSFYKDDNEIKEDIIKSLNKQD